MDILNIILKDTYSLIHLKHRLALLKAFLLQNFFGGPQVTQVKEDPNLLKLFTRDNVYKIFEDLEKQIPSLKTLTVYLTFEPDDATMAQIGEKARKTFENLTLLLDIKYDPRLIAGAAFSFNGIYKDYSLSSRIEERKLAILESFKKFLR